MIDLDERWFEFTSTYVKKLNEHGGHNWEKLNQEEQELAALRKLEVDIYNGGFIQFFCNWGFECYTHAVRCLKKINANKCLNIIIKQYSIVQRLEDDERLKEYWDIPKLLSDEERIIIDKLDHEYWDNTDDVQTKTFLIYKHLTQ